MIAITKGATVVQDLVVKIVMTVRTHIRIKCLGIGQNGRKTVSSSSGMKNCNGSRQAMLETVAVQHEKVRFVARKQFSFLVLSFHHVNRCQFNIDFRRTKH